jgi:hypothetical protein
VKRRPPYIQESVFNPPAGLEEGFSRESNAPADQPD